MGTMTVKFVAIEPVEFKKVESKVEGGFARIQQKVEVAEAPLIMDFMMPVGNENITFKAGKTKAILKGDAGLAPWNKAVFEYKGKRFVMCPVSEVLGWSAE